MVRWTAAFAGVRGLRKAVAEAVAEAVVTVVKMILEVVVLDLVAVAAADLLHEGVVDNRCVMAAIAGRLHGVAAAAAVDFLHAAARRCEDVRR